MAENYHVVAYRMFYTQLRRSTKAPVMIVVKSTWGWYAETKNGKMLFDQRKCHCAWCAKAEAIDAWQRMQPDQQKA